MVTDAGEWQKLAKALRDLHRSLLERARRDYEREHGIGLTSGEFLQLLTTHDEFAWLRGLSELMVDIDFVHDATPADRADFAPAVRGAIEQLLANTQGPPGAFAARYWHYVHDEPQVALAHAAVKQVLSGWPPPAKTDAASVLHERHRLTEKARHLAKRK